MNIQVNDPALEIHDLTVAYDKKPVLWNVDLTVPQGQLAGIIGPNGAGKSTLLKAILGLVPIQSGYVKLLGHDLEAIRQEVGYVPQRESVDWDFPASVMDVVLMGRYGKAGLFRRTSKKDREVAMEALERVDMAAYRNRQIGQLSGGQQQRVFLARALAQEASIYLMDEPFAGVDAASEKAIIDLLRTLTQQGKTVLVVHHDLQSAIDYFEWSILINTRLIASGPVDQVFTRELLQETYGGKLSILTDLSNLMYKKRFPQRETGP